MEYVPYSSVKKRKAIDLQIMVYCPILYITVKELFNLISMTYEDLLPQPIYFLDWSQSDGIGPSVGQISRCQK